MSTYRLVSLMIALVFLSVDPSSAQVKDQGGPEYTPKEIRVKMDSVSPDPEDYQFDKPSTWSNNLARHAQILPANRTAESDSLSKIIDGRPATSWESEEYDPRPEIVLDLGKTIILSKLAVFNKHTDSRGASGGNNAVSKIEVQVSQSPRDTDYKTIRHYEIEGPKLACLPRQGGGQRCSHMPRTDPWVVDLNDTKARRLKLILEEAHWREGISPSKKSSVALSEVMLYQAFE